MSIQHQQEPPGVGQCRSLVGARWAGCTEGGCFHIGGPALGGPAGEAPWASGGNGGRGLFSTENPSVHLNFALGTCISHCEHTDSR